MEKELFKMTAQSSQTAARRGQLVTAHGTYQTPILVAAAQDEDSAKTNDTMIWTNGLTTKARFHEHQLRTAGGLHGVYGWSGGLVNTAGSWGVFNSGHQFKLDQKGIHYQAREKQVYLSPENNVKGAVVAGADITVALSDCPPYYASYDHIKKHVEQNNRWMKRAAQSKERQQLNLFGVIEGAGLKELRQASVDFVADLGFDGYEIGGFTKDAPADEVKRVVQETAAMLPTGKPRLLSHVSDPTVLQSAVNNGVDIILASPDADVTQLQNALRQVMDNF